MNKIILFDFDGTLADSYENFLEIAGILIKKYNLPPTSREELEKLRTEDASTLIKHLKIPLYKIPFLARDMKKMQQEKIADIKPIKGIPEALHKLKKMGLSLGILTSNGKENVQRFITNNNIDIFSYIYSDSSLFGKDKMISKFIKQNNVDKENVTYIGDEIRDIRACQSVGIEIIAVSWGFNTHQGLEKFKPDFIINKPGELVTLLQKKATLQ